MRRFRVGLILVVVFVLSLLAMPVLAQEGGDPPVSAQPQDLVLVLTNLTRALGIGFVVTFLFKSPGWFLKLPSQARWWIIFGLCLGLPVVAQLLLDFVPPQVWEVLNPYWKALSWGFITWGASQILFEKYIKPARSEGGV